MQEVPIKKRRLAEPSSKTCKTCPEKTETVNPNQNTHDDFPLPVAPMMAFRPGAMAPLGERERSYERFVSCVVYRTP